MTRALPTVLVMLLLPAMAWGQEATGWTMQPIDINLEDKPSLQNGARLFMNYCFGCHSLQFQRHALTAEDLEIPEEIYREQLIFTDQKIGDLMEIAMPEEQATAWFGAAPPDLTMVTRVRSPEWVYNYLQAFYIDESRPFGVNNKVFPNVGMPHVLIGLQGVPVETCKQVPMQAANGGQARDPLIPGKALTEKKCGIVEVVEGTGSLTAEEFDQAVYDITNFLTYVGDPTRLERQRIGVYVLLFLVILGVFTYLLKREFWKDVH